MTPDSPARLRIGIALSRRGHDVQVFEKHDALAAPGAGLLIMYRSIAEPV